MQVNTRYDEIGQPEGYPDYEAWSLAAYQPDQFGCWANPRPFLYLCQLMGLFQYAMGASLDDSCRHHCYDVNGDHSIDMKDWQIWVNKITNEAYTNFGHMTACQFTCIAWNFEQYKDKWWFTWYKNQWWHTG